jgi:hypothetical protein
MWTITDASGRFGFIEESDLLHKALTAAINWTGDIPGQRYRDWTEYVYRVDLYTISWLTGK